ncbi:MAG: nucleotide exchange factor GrpE [Bacillota bacterium]|nr:nucleotide exchange factor GrpE [Bacillota bacterium]
MPGPGDHRDRDPQTAAAGGPEQGAGNEAEAAGETGAAGAAAPAPAAQVDDWRAQAEDNYNRFLRARADYDNLARRTEREVHRLVRLGKKDLLMRLLELADNMDRALAGWRQALAGVEGIDPDSLTGGVAMIARQLQAVLAAEGVVPVEAVGKPFDPALHEAVAVWESADVTAETVTDELRKGYTQGGEVLRPAQVRVARPRS